MHKTLLVLTSLVPILAMVAFSVIPASAAHENFITIVGDRTPIPTASFSYSGSFSITTPEQVFVRVIWGDGNSEFLKGTSVFYNTDTRHGNWGALHSYSSEGPRTIAVTLEVPDVDGGTTIVSRAAFNVNVQSVPEITSIILSTPRASVQKTISASGSFQTGLGTQCVIVDWGDGEETIVSGQNVKYDSFANSGTWDGAEHTYRNTGSFSVSAIQGGIDVDSGSCITRGTSGTDTIDIVAEQVIISTNENRIVWGDPATFFGTITTSSENNPCIIIDWDDGTPATTVVGSNMAIDLGTGAGDWFNVSHEFARPDLYSITAVQGQVSIGVDVSSTRCITRGEPYHLVIEVQPHDSGVLLDQIEITESGSTITVSGRLVDEETDTGIANGEIRLSGSGVSSFGTRLVMTDNRGDFSIQGPSTANAIGALDVMASFDDTELYSDSSDIIRYTVAVANNPPIANAGPDQGIDTGGIVTLDGTGSFDPDPGDHLNYSWTQTEGHDVQLLQASSARPTFESPQVNEDTVIRFRLVVNDGQIDSIRPDFVSITLRPGGSLLTIEISKEPTEAFVRITITGSVGQASVVSSRSASLQFTKADGSSSQPFVSVPVYDDGTYTYSRDFADSDNGLWKVTITYAGLSQTRDFDVAVGSGIPLWAYVIGIFSVPIGVVAAKYLIPKPTPTWYLRADIELEDEAKRDNEVFNEQVGTPNRNEQLDIENNLKDTLVLSTTQAKQALNIIKEGREVVDLCDKGKKDPDELVSDLATRGFNQMLDRLTPEYGKFFIQEITIESEVQILEKSKKDGKKRMATDIEVKMKPLKPFIEVGIGVNGVPTKSLRIEFKLDTVINIERAELVLLTLPDNRIETNLENIVASLKLSLGRIVTTGLQLPFGIEGRILDKPIKLVKKDFQLQSLTTRDIESRNHADISNSQNKGVDSAVRDTYCNRCSSSVRALRFCTQCGNRLL